MFKASTMLYPIPIEDVIMSKFVLKTEFKEYLEIKLFPPFVKLVYNLLYSISKFNIIRITINITVTPRNIILLKSMCFPISFTKKTHIAKKNITAVVDTKNRLKMVYTIE